MELVDIRSGKEPEKCFKITYNSGEVELVMATTMGSTEDLKEFITFYIEDDRGLELVCMINQFLIRKIETTLAPKVSLIVNGEKIYE